MSDLNPKDLAEKDPISAVIDQMKKQTGKHYRLVQLDPTNVSMKKARGYEFVKKEDAEVKGTALEQHQAADGTIRVGGLALARTSETQYRRNRAAVQERLDKRLRATKKAYLAEGENIKRKLGSHHGDFKVIHKQED